jgi:predicted dehydrogenase
MDRVRIGLIGAGGISRAHIPGYLQCQDRALITAIAEPREEAAHAAQQAMGGEIYADWRDLLDRADVDAVDICLPHDLHAPVAVAAAECGKHILVEKPIARDLREADAMIAAAERAGVKLMVCHDRRFHPAFAKIKEVIDSGVLGRLLLLRLDHNQYIRLAPSHWIFQKESLGGGAVMSCLVHQFDLIRWYGGDVSQVGGLSLTLPDRMEGEIISVCPLRFVSGALGDTVINWNLNGRGKPGSLWYELVWLSGTDGNLHNWNGIHLLRQDRDQGYETIPVAEGTGHPRAIAHFVDCLLEGREPLTNGREGRAALELAMAAYASEESERLIHLPLADNRIGSRVDRG